MNTAQEFNSLYMDVAHHIEKTLADIERLHIDNDEGKQHLEKMTSHFRALQDSFNSKMTFLEKHAEWDKFTLAFFGETNAGKSTIIESLRILFNEESREQFIKENQDDLDKAEKELSDNLEHFSTALTDVYKDLSERIAHICNLSERLKKVVDSESAKRLELEVEESNARLLLEKYESDTRIDILKQQTSKKNRLIIVGVSVVSFALGTCFIEIMSKVPGAF